MAGEYWWDGIDAGTAFPLKGLWWKHSEDFAPKGLSASFLNPAVVTNLMLRQRDETAWLQRGSQRAAVARVLRKPMTGTEICAAARVFNSHIQLRDVWHLLRQMERRGLVQCYNPRLVTGRLYLLTPKGRATVQKAFAILMPRPPADIDWWKYSWVIRAKIRRLTLSGLGQLETKAPRTATEIRRHIRDEYSAGLNPVLRAVRELADKDLIACVGVTPVRACKLYRLTPTGRSILQQLRQ
jgi:DNA-binding PadR family transcriptional regulator